MRILHLCNRFTGRVAKLMRVLSPGHEQVLCCKQIPSAFVQLAIEHPIVSYNNPQGLYHLATGFDVVYCHYSLDSQQVFKDFLAEVGCRRVLDIHDWDHNLADCLQHMDAVVVPTDGYRSKAKSAVVVHNKVPLCWKPKNSTKDRGTCLIGTMAMEPAYFDYRETYKAFNGAIDVFATGPVDMSMGIPCYQSMPYLFMLEHASRYMVGFAGAPNSKTNVDAVITNKFWEYLACGCMVALETPTKEWPKPKLMEDVLDRVMLGYEDIWLDSELDILEAVING